MIIVTFIIITINHNPCRNHYHQQNHSNHIITNIWQRLRFLKYLNIIIFFSNHHHYHYCNYNKIIIWHKPGQKEVRSNTVCCGNPRFRDRKFQISAVRPSSQLWLLNYLQISKLCKNCTCCPVSLLKCQITMNVIIWGSQWSDMSTFSQGFTGHQASLGALWRCSLCVFSLSFCRSGHGNWQTIFLNSHNSRIALRRCSLNVFDFVIAIAIVSAFVILFVSSSLWSNVYLTKITSL